MNKLHESKRAAMVDTKMAKSEMFPSHSPDNPDGEFLIVGVHKNWGEYFKQTFTKYPAIHTNYSLSNCTISNRNDFNRSSDFLVIN